MEIDEKNKQKESIEKELLHLEKVYDYLKKKDEILKKLEALQDYCSKSCKYNK